MRWGDGGSLGGAGWVKPTPCPPLRVGFTHPTDLASLLGSHKTEVIPSHLDGLREGGEAVPLPESVAEWVEV